MRAADPDNNTRSGASSSSPPLHAEVRAAVEEILANIEPGEFLVSLPDGTSYITSTYTLAAKDICQAVAEALLAGLPEQFGVDDSKDAEGSWLFRQGWNEALDAVTRVMGEVLGSNSDALRNARSEE